jgi:hypothetical protein
LPFLTVLGNSSWRTGEHVFKPGVHAVTEDVAARARASGIRSLILTDEAPAITRPRGTGEPLTVEDLALGQTGVRLVPPLPPEEAVVEVDLYEVPRDWHCPHCPQDFPSKGSLVRHIEFHHAVSR